MSNNEIRRKYEEQMNTLIENSNFGIFNITVFGNIDEIGPFVLEPLSMYGIPYPDVVNLFDRQQYVEAEMLNYDINMLLSNFDEKDEDKKDEIIVDTIKMLEMLLKNGAVFVPVKAYHFTDNMIKTEKGSINYSPLLLKTLPAIKDYTYDAAEICLENFIKKDYAYGYVNVFVDRPLKKEEIPELFILTNELIKLYDEYAKELFKENSMDEIYRNRFNESFKILNP